MHILLSSLDPISILPVDAVTPRELATFNVGHQDCRVCLRDLASSRRQGQVSCLWPVSSPVGCKRGALQAHTFKICSHACLVPMVPSVLLLLLASRIRTKLSAEMRSIRSVLLNLDHVASLTLPAVCWLQAVSEAVEDVKSSLPHLAAGTALHLEPESIYALVPQNWLQVSLQVLPDGLGSQGNVLFNTSPASN